MRPNEPRSRQLLAGVAVPSLAYVLMPRWVGWLGLVLAATAELSTLSLLFPTLAVLVPVGRFPALIWLIAAGLTLTTRRPA